MNPARRTLAALGLGALVTLTTLAAAPAAAQVVRLETSEGEIRLQLDRAAAPKTVDNFVAYVKAGHYDGTIFHRVIADFMIQGGGMTASMQEKPTRAPIELESRNGLSNERGTVAMARTAAPNSATAQFFINVRDNPALDQPRARDGQGYAVFGKVIAGMDVVDRIRAVPTRTQGFHSDVPVQPVVIRKATLVSQP